MLTKKLNKKFSLDNVILLHITRTPNLIFLNTHAHEKVKKKFPPLTLVYGALLEHSM